MVYNQQRWNHYIGAPAARSRRPYGGQNSRTSYDRNSRYDTRSSSAVPHSSYEKLRSALPYRVGRGLLNLGNSCFLNSVLQALIHTPEIERCIRGHMSACVLREGEGCAVCELAKLIRESLDSHKCSACRPDGMIALLHSWSRRTSCSLRSGRQEDAHEYLRVLLDACDSSMQRLMKTVHGIQATTGASTWVDDVFGGELVTETTCDICGPDHCSRARDAFQDLSLDVGAPGITSVAEAFRRFVLSERLVGKNQYACERCGNHVNASKRMMLHRVPIVLVVHLKRFQYSEFGGQKISKKIDFEQELNLDRLGVLSPLCFVQNRDSAGEGRWVKHTSLSQTQLQLQQRLTSQLSLYAVVVHSGSSKNTGHYVCYVRPRVVCRLKHGTTEINDCRVSGDEDAELWLLYNDGHITRTKWSQVKCAQAYMLFYRNTASSTLGAASQYSRAAPSASAWPGHSASPSSSHAPSNGGRRVGASPVYYGCALPPGYRPKRAGNGHNTAKTTAADTLAKANHGRSERSAEYSTEQRDGYSNVHRNRRLPGDDATNGGVLRNGGLNGNCNGQHNAHDNGHFNDNNRDGSYHDGFRYKNISNGNASSTLRGHAAVTKPSNGQPKSGLVESTGSVSFSCPASRKGDSVRELRAAASGGSMSSSQLTHNGQVTVQDQVRSQQREKVSISLPRKSKSSKITSLIRSTSTVSSTAKKPVGSQPPRSDLDLGKLQAFFAKRKAEKLKKAAPTSSSIRANGKSDGPKAVTAKDFAHVRPKLSSHDVLLSPPPVKKRSDSSQSIRSSNQANGFEHSGSPQLAVIAAQQHPNSVAGTLARINNANVGRLTNKAPPAIAPGAPLPTLASLPPYVPTVYTPSVSTLASLPPPAPNNAVPSRKQQESLHRSPKVRDSSLA